MAATTLSWFPSSCNSRWNLVSCFLFSWEGFLLQRCIVWCFFDAGHLLKSCFEVLGGTIVTLINQSLSETLSSCFSYAWKTHLLYAETVSDTSSSAQSHYLVNGQWESNYTCCSAAFNIVDSAFPCSIASFNDLWSIGSGLNWLLPILSSLSSLSTPVPFRCGVPQDSVLSP